MENYLLKDSQELSEKIVSIWRKGGEEWVESIADKEFEAAVGFSRHLGKGMRKKYIHPYA